MRDSIENRLAVIIICCLGLIAYSNSFQGSFHFDDEPSITDNFAVRNIGNPGIIWQFWPTRFITYLSIALNYHWGGFQVFGYHLVNFSLHLGASLLFWWLVTLTLALPLIKKGQISAHAKLFAFFAAAIFLVHPIQTQPVNYIIQRATILAAFFYIASLSLYIKARLKQIQGGSAGVNGVYYAGSLLAALLSMFSKEMAVTLPFAICLYEFYFLKAEDKLNWKYIAPFLAIALLIPLTMLFTRSVDIQQMNRAGEYVPRLSGGQYFLTQIRVMATYFRLLLLPLNQNLDYDYPAQNSLLQIPVILSLSLILIILGIAFRLFKNYRLPSFGIIWFFITLLPESSIFPISDVIIEHRLYLPMAGFSLFLVSALYYLLKEKRLKLTLTILILLLACYSIVTYQRNKAWKGELSLWTDTVRKSPLKARGYLSRGLAFQMKGDLSQALSDYNKAIELKPEFAEAYNNRGLVYFDKGDLNQALSDYNKAIKLKPRLAKAYYNRGFIYFYKGGLNQALSDYNKAIELKPDLAEAYNNRGLVYFDKGDLNQALIDFSQAIKLKPGFAKAHYNRGVVYRDKGDLSKALSDYNKAIELKPGLVEAYTNRGNVYLSMGDFEKAILDCNRAIELKPDYAAAYNNRAMVYFKKQDYAKSLEDLHKAQMLGWQVNPEFIEQLKRLSGRDK